MVGPLRVPLSYDAEAFIALAGDETRENRTD